MIDSASTHRMRTLATIVAVAALWSLPTDAAPNCLAQPNLKAADGRHWYYRTDHANKRKCWYVKPRSESFGLAAAKEPPAAKPIPTPPPRPPSLNTIWNRLFPDPLPSEPAAEVANAQAYHPVNAMQAPTHDRNTDDHADMREPPPISLAYITDEPPMAPAVEGQNVALIALALLLIALVAGAGMRQRAGKVSGGRRADYLAVLSRAIANADPHDREARRDIYTCARRVLVDQMRAADPPVGEAVIKAEQAALDAAIAQLEAQGPYGHKRGPSPLRALTDRAFAPRFGSGGTRHSARRRLGEIATWALRASRPA